MVMLWQSMPHLREKQNNAFKLLLSAVITQSNLYKGLKLIRNRYIE